MAGRLQRAAQWIADMPPRMARYLVLHREVKGILYGAVVVFWSLLALFGTIQFLLQKDLTFYAAMLGSSLTLAGFAVAAGTLTTSQSRVKLFIRSSIVFLVSALMMLSNFVAAFYLDLMATATTPNQSLTNYAVVFTAIGWFGSFVFLIGLADLILGLMEWYYHPEIVLDSLDRL